jgi:hypothetical protein
MKKVKITIIVFAALFALMLIISLVSSYSYEPIIRYHIWRIGNGAFPCYHWDEEKIISGVKKETLSSLGGSVFRFVDDRHENADDLVAMGPIVISYMQEIVINDNYKQLQKLAAIYILGKLGDSVVELDIHCLIKSLSSQEAIIRQNALKIFMEHIKDKRLIPILLNRLDDREFREEINDYPFSTVFSGDRAITIRMYALKELMCRIKQSDNPLGVDYLKDLDYNTQKWNQVKMTLNNWWEENRDYIYVINQQSKSTFEFAIDHEAKAAGVPTDEYRKTHPWPAENTPK